MSAENRMLSLLTASVSHEMLTPLKCIIEFALSLMNELNKSPQRYTAELILSTSKLLLSQVKMLLDKNLLDNDHFVPCLAAYDLNKTITNVV